LPLYEQRRQIIQGEITNFTDFVPKFDESYQRLEKDCAEIVKKKEDEKDKEKEEENKITDVSYLKNT
jgi:hypothetical protein